MIVVGVNLVEQGREVAVSREHLVENIFEAVSLHQLEDDGERGVAGVGHQDGVGAVVRFQESKEVQQGLNLRYHFE